MLHLHRMNERTVLKKQVVTWMTRALLGCGWGFPQVKKKLKKQVTFLSTNGHRNFFEMSTCRGIRQR
jgi:hypothetical protein